MQNSEIRNNLNFIVRYINQRTDLGLVVTQINTITDDNSLPNIRAIQNSINSIQRQIPPGRTDINILIFDIVRISQLARINFQRFKDILNSMVILLSGSVGAGDIASSESIGRASAAFDAKKKKRKSKKEKIKNLKKESLKIKKINLS